MVIEKVVESCALIREETYISREAIFKIKWVNVRGNYRKAISELSKKMDFIENFIVNYLRFRKSVNNG